METLPQDVIQHLCSYFFGNETEKTLVRLSISSKYWQKLGRFLTELDLTTHTLALLRAQDFPHLRRLRLSAQHSPPGIRGRRHAGRSSYATIPINPGFRFFAVKNTLLGLSELKIDRVPIRSAALSRLPQLTSLTSLTIIARKVNDKIVSKVTRLTKLRSLILAHKTSRRDGRDTLAKLSPLTNLTRLSIPSATVDAIVHAQLPPKLKTLHIARIAELDGESQHTVSLLCQASPRFANLLTGLLTLDPLSLLAHCAYEGHLEQAKLLLKHGADVNGDPGEFAPLIQPYTPLHMAMAGQKEALIDLLLANGADLNGRYTSAKHLPPAWSIFDKNIHLVRFHEKATGDLVLKVLKPGFEPSVVPRGSLPPIFHLARDFSKPVFKQLIEKFHPDLNQVVDGIGLLSFAENGAQKWLAKRGADIWKPQLVTAEISAGEAMKGRLPTPVTEFLFSSQRCKVKNELMEWSPLAMTMNFLALNDNQAFIQKHNQRPPQSFDFTTQPSKWNIMHIICRHANAFSAEHVFPFLKFLFQGREADLRRLINAESADLLRPIQLLWMGPNSRQHYLSKLLDLGAELDFEPNNYPLPLILALRAGDYESASYLLDLGVSVKSSPPFPSAFGAFLSSQTESRDIRSSDHYVEKANSKLSLEVFEKLVERGATIDEPSGPVQSPPIALCRRMVPELPIFQRALRQKPNLRLRDRVGMVPLQHFLLQHQFPAEMHNMDPEAMYSQAVGGQTVVHMVLALALSEHQPDHTPNLADLDDLDFRRIVNLQSVVGTPLFLAATIFVRNQQSDELVRKMIASGGDLNLPFNFGLQPPIANKTFHQTSEAEIEYAAGVVRDETIFLAVDTPRTLSTPTSFYHTRLLGLDEFIAKPRRNVTMAHLLRPQRAEAFGQLKALGLDLNARTDQDETPLFFHTARRNTTAVGALLSAGIDTAARNSKFFLLRRTGGPRSHSYTISADPILLHPVELCLRLFPREESHFDALAHFRTLLAFFHFMATEQLLSYLSPPEVLGAEIIALEEWTRFQAQPYASNPQFPHLPPTLSRKSILQTVSLEHWGLIASVCRRELQNCGGDFAAANAPTASLVASLLIPGTLLVEAMKHLLDLNERGAMVLCKSQTPETQAILLEALALAQESLKNDTKRRPRQQRGIDRWSY